MLVKKAGLQLAFKHAAVMRAAMNVGEDCICSDRIACNSGACQLLDNSAGHPQAVIQSMPKANDLAVLYFGDCAKPCRLALISCKGENLRSGKKLDLATVVMADVYPTHTGGDHAVSSYDDAVGAVKRDNDCHPRKTLLAFISGYRL